MNSRYCSAIDAVDTVFTSTDTLGGIDERVLSRGTKMGKLKVNVGRIAW